MAASPSKTLFLKSVNTEEQDNDTEWLSKDIHCVIDRIVEECCRHNYGKHCNKQESVEHC